MSQLHMGKGGIRKSFGKIKDIVPIPNLIEIQSSSFNDFVQLDYLPGERKPIGLHKVLQDVFPIEHGDKMSLGYVSYELGSWACTCGKLSGIENRYQWHCTACKATGCSRLNEDLQCSHCKKLTARYKVCSNCLFRVVIKMPMTLSECRSSGQSFSMSLKVRIQLISWVLDDKGKRTVHDIKEQDIFFADVPVMVDLYEENDQFKLGNAGTFLINGVDRVIVSQLHRSPGVVFSQSKKTKDFRGRPYYLARIIPMRGSWMDFEFDSNDVLYVRIDKKKKLLVTTFLQALGFDRDRIISLFYDVESISAEDGLFFRDVGDHLIGLRIEKDMLPSGKEEDALLGKRLTTDSIKFLKKFGIARLSIRPSTLVNRVLGKDLVDGDTGEIIVEQGQTLNENHLDLISKMKKIKLEVIKSAGYSLQPSIPLTLNQDQCFNRDEAFREIQGKVWPGDSASLAEIKERFHNLFFNNNRTYDLTRVGRVRMNRKLDLNIPENKVVLTPEDILATVRYLVNLRERGEGELDDIDHLGNRRVRLVGELLTNQIHMGLLRIERIVRERFRMQEPHGALMPQDFLNVKPISAVLREFFGLGQLSQFMDQTNPLAELAHKRRLSALGPGGVMKDRATYEIRDVHMSHYGRICPIETPEGQTVGLISSLATYALVNDLGFIETGYRPVKNGKAQDEVVFLDAFEEFNQYIGQSDVSNQHKMTESDKIFARHQGNYSYVSGDKISYVDLSPKQLVSVSSALIPFLEHDDASRALMGANMQRQAVPLILPESPLVGTGMEAEIGKSAGAVITAKRSGVIEYASSEKIIVRADEDEFTNIDSWISSGINTYYLRKFQRSSYSTWIHQSPIVKRGDKVNAGDILTDGTATESGELALGSNLLVAFMPWHGYNFEDAIVLNQRLVADDTLTSVHIDEYVSDARDTKLGPEEITKDIPNVAESALVGLDDDGVVRIGTRVKPGDILVGKVTLKGDIQFSPEEKLLRAIFGEKSREVRDTSLRVPPGVEGTIVDVKIFSRSGIRKDKRYKEEVTKQTLKIESDFNDHVAFLQAMVCGKIVEDLVGKKPAKGVAKKVILKAVFDREKMKNLELSYLSSLKTTKADLNKRIKHLGESFENQVRILTGLKEERIAKLKKGDQLPSGVIKMVKVYIAMKRAISVGDKLAGRHGNKGVVSTLVPREDMPYTEDGTPVDIVLSPLGVPSRMNVGQLLETVLGLAGKELGQRLTEVLETEGYKSVKSFLQKTYGADLVDAYEKEYGKEGITELAQKSAKSGIRFKTPIFDSAQLDSDIKPLLKSLDLPESGALRLRDGRTGEYFDQPITTGIMYIMKLNHMVDDKLHARSVGPYSLVTQQPLGGKAQLGGQRLGEMEVWALEAYGAAYTLQEMLTYKSDDVTGRHKVYEAIVRGENLPEPGVPESFNVLIKELQSLGLQVDLFRSGKETVGE